MRWNILCSKYWPSSIGDAAEFGEKREMEGGMKADLNTDGTALSSPNSQ
jgi:hypothetical protein